MTPYPLRYGGGAKGGTTNKPQLELVAESLATQMGTAYSQDVRPVTSQVGLEGHAYARALAFDGYGSNERLRNELYPPTSYSLLPRHERNLGVYAMPGDTSPVRQARVAAKWLRVGVPNWHQPVVDALTNALGSSSSGGLFTTIVYNDTSNATTYWPGGATNPSYPWYSTIFVARVQLAVPANYKGSTGAPNAAWWAAVHTAGALLDSFLPIWMTYMFFILSSHGAAEFRLDEPDLDLEVLT